MTIPMKPRYVAYFRVSTQKQGRSGLGLDAQKQAVKDFLQQFGGELNLKGVKLLD